MSVTDDWDHPWDAVAEAVDERLNTDHAEGRIGRLMAKYVTDSILPLVHDTVIKEGGELPSVCRAEVLASLVSVGPFDFRDADTFLREVADELREWSPAVAEALDRIAHTVG